jgi:hypothetical protein
VDRDQHQQQAKVLRKASVAKESLYLYTIYDSFMHVSNIEMPIRSLPRIFCTAYLVTHGKVCML